MVTLSVLKLALRDFDVNLCFRGFNFILGMISPIMSGDLEHPVLGVNVAFIWGTLNLGCFLYVFLFIPELKGLDLEQVDEL